MCGTTARFRPAGVAARFIGHRIGNTYSVAATNACSVRHWNPDLYAGAGVYPTAFATGTTFHHMGTADQPLYESTRTRLRRVNVLGTLLCRSLCGGVVHSSHFCALSAV